MTEPGATQHGQAELRVRKEITGRDFKQIKNGLLASLANGGQPIIEVTDANHENRGELVLTHRFDEQASFQTRSILAVPLLSKGRRLGVIELVNGAEEICP